MINIITISKSKNQVSILHNNYEEKRNVGNAIHHNNYEEKNVRKNMEWILVEGEGEKHFRRDTPKYSA